MYSVVFCGTPDFAVPSLRALIEHPEFDVQLVITQPDKPVGRKQILTPPPVKQCAEECNIAIAQPDNINTFHCPLSTAHYLVVVAYGQILKQPLLDWPEIAPVNLHPSLLPQWRGASPLQHAILHGDTQTGVTVQQMVLQMDSGPILAQETLELDNTYTAPVLHDQLADMGAQLLVDTLSKPLNPVEQDESKVTMCHKLSREDGIVDPNTMTAEEVDRTVRALVPWPGVLCTIQGESVKLLQTSLQESPDTMELPCAEDTSLYIQKLQSPAKRPMAGAEWMRGHQ